VIEQPVEIRTADGTAEGFLYDDENHKRLPGVPYLTDIGGIRDANRGMARRYFTSQSNASSRVLKVGRSRCEKTLMWS